MNSKTLVRVEERKKNGKLGYAYLNVPSILYDNALDEKKGTGSLYFYQSLYERNHLDELNRLEEYIVDNLPNRNIMLYSGIKRINAKKEIVRVIEKIKSFFKI